MPDHDLHQMIISRLEEISAGLRENREELRETRNAIDAKLDAINTTIGQHATRLEVNDVTHNEIKSDLDAAHTKIRALESKLGLLNYLPVIQTIAKYAIPTLATAILVYSVKTCSVPAAKAAIIQAVAK